GALANSALMISAHDTQPPAPVWVEQDTVQNFHRTVSSSRENDVHVAMHQRYAPGSTTIRRALLRKYSSGSSTNDWARVIPVDIAGHPYSTTGVSWDGQRIVSSVYDFSISKTRVELLGPESPMPLAV